MTYETSDFFGDEIHTINCTGDACKGDEIAFDQATFTGSYRRARFNGFERVVGTIVSESYGEAKQQHTFTIQLSDGSKKLIKGRNLYANGVWRKPWANEADRRLALADKHERGDAARYFRERRKSQSDDFIDFSAGI